MCVCVWVCTLVLMFIIYKELCVVSKNKLASYNVMFMYLIAIIIVQYYIGSYYYYKCMLCCVNCN